MKVFIILVLTVVKLNADLATENAKIIAAQKACEAELGEPKDLIQKIRDGQDIGDEYKAGKIALCLNVKAGHMDKKGEVIPDKFKQHVFNLTNDDEKRKKVIADCGSSIGDTPEKRALNFVKCMVEFSKS